MNLFSLKIPVTALVMVLLFSCSTPNKIAQEKDTSFLYGDALPDAPELSARGNFKVGVRTLEFIHAKQVDILHSKGGVDPLYDRPLKVEVWYPAIVPNGKKELVTYNTTLGLFNDSTRPLIPYTYNGRAS